MASIVQSTVLKMRYDKTQVSRNVIASSSPPHFDRQTAQLLVNGHVYVPWITKVLTNMLEVKTIQNSQVLKGNIVMIIYCRLSACDVRSLICIHDHNWIKYEHHDHENLHINLIWPIECVYERNWLQYVQNFHRRVPYFDSDTYIIDNTFVVDKVRNNVPGWYKQMNCIIKCQSLLKHLICCRWYEWCY